MSVMYTIITEVTYKHVPFKERKICENQVSYFNSKLRKAVYRTNAKTEREKGRDMTQSYDKSPYTSRNVKRAK